MARVCINCAVRLNIRKISCLTRVLHVKFIARNIPNFYRSGVAWKLIPAKQAWSLSNNVDHIKPAKCLFFMTKLKSKTLNMMKKLRRISTLVLVETNSKLRRYVIWSRNIFETEELLRGFSFPVNANMCCRQRFLKTLWNY